MTTLHDLHQTIGGRLLARGGRARCRRPCRLGRVVTDSRQVERGDVFWALAGAEPRRQPFRRRGVRSRGRRRVVAGAPVDVPEGRWAIAVDDTQQALRPMGRVEAATVHRDADRA